MLLAISAAPSLRAAVPRRSQRARPSCARAAVGGCLGDPDPKVRDASAFEGLSLGHAIRRTRTANAGRRSRRDLLDAVAAAWQLGDPPFVLGADPVGDRANRSHQGVDDRRRASGAHRCRGGVPCGISDYRAFSNQEGFVHAVAHGADFALQLALNPAITKPQLDKLLIGDRRRRSRRGDPGVAYWAGEPDRLARAVVFIAQRKLHSDAEWKAWFANGDESEAAAVVGCGLHLRDWHPQAPQCPRVSPERLCDRQSRAKTPASSS